MLHGTKKQLLKPSATAPAEDSLCDSRLFDFAILDISSNALWLLGMQGTDSAAMTRTCSVNDDAYVSLHFCILVAEIQLRGVYMEIPSVFLA